MGKEILKLGNIDTAKNKFYRHNTQKRHKKVLVSNKISFGEKIWKYLIGTCIMITKFNHFI